MHRDLKPLNILIKRNFFSYIPICKISDFGLSTIKQEEDKEFDTVGWMAPEVMQVS